MSRSRAWVFTLNNYTEEEVEKWKNINCVYLIFGKEVAPTTGTPHLQGYVYFENAKTLGGMKKICERSKFEAARGSAKQNNVYCSKDGDVFTKGKAPEQGERTDIAKAKDDIMNGKRCEEILLENPVMMHQYGRTLDRIEDLAMRKKFRTEMTKGIWIWGKTGVGKSHKAFEGYSPETHYVWSGDEKWWCAYRQQDTVIINDFRGEMRYGFLLQLVDKWPMVVHRKNREPIPFTSKRVIITSSMPPDIVYSGLDKKDGIEQLLRRFEVIEMTNDDWLQDYEA